MVGVKYRASPHLIGQMKASIRARLNRRSYSDAAEMFGRHKGANWGAWKDADPDIPILKQAKAEYARLQ
jgi:hypothetical protein